MDKETEDRISRLEKTVFPEMMPSQKVAEDRIGGLTIPEWQQLAELGDVLVRSSLTSPTPRGRYLKEVIADSGFTFSCWNYGTSSETGEASSRWKQVRLVESNRWRPNPGYQPVPDRVIVEVEHFNGVIDKRKASVFRWELKHLVGSCIISFRIIGVADD